MKKEELKRRLINASEQMLNAQEELSLIDSHFGDADHGLTMAKVGNAIISAVNESTGSIKDMMDNISMAVMVLNGGSAIPLWSSWIEGMAEVAEDTDETDLNNLKEMFANGLKEISDLSTAKVGDKTLMDALIPASKAIAESNNEEELFIEAAKAANQGAQDSKNYVAKFGRAKSYGEKTIGTADAGALSMSYFFQGLTNTK